MEKRYAPQLFRAKEIDRDKFTVRFVMSTPEVDRHGEVVDQNGWDFNNYLKNPVVLWAHNQDIPPVGKVISIEKTAGATEGVVQFAYNENPDAKILFELVAGGYLNAVSVGFMNTKWMFDEENDILTLLENELFELSIVNVPANASALAKAKTKGIDVSVIDRLNKGKDAVKAEDRFKNLGVEIKEEEKVEDKKDEEEGDDEGDKNGDHTGDDVDDDEASGDADVDAGAGDDASEEEVKSAIATIAKAKPSQLKEAVSQLGKLSKDEDTAQKVDTTPSAQGLAVKRYSKHSINRAIRVLLAETSK